ncbi:M91 family zinc metallopeptidase [Stenotrophomonas geniculata]|uniref:M91 family zinc metallopeptidase n=1 Tax=Stenotrophomonas geniculata TaxID=86188 RepID=UPI00370ABF52
MNGLCSLLIRAVLAVVVLAACVAPAVAQEVVEYIHTDALGSPVAITDASGNVIERTVYEPYGAVVNRPLKDGPGYTGHVTDSGTGLSYMQQRYYDVEVGRFLSVDPVVARDSGDSRYLARYSYGYLNPYRFVDPDGRKVVISGDKEFRKMINEQLKKISSSPAGRRLIRELKKSIHTFTISKSDGGSSASPMNMNSATNGVGTGGEVKHNPAETPVAQTYEGPKATPAHIVLAHELGHARDYSRGSLDRRVNPLTNVPVAESNAMGVENDVRRDLGLPERSRY